jgi:hypothetical protein
LRSLFFADDKSAEAAKLALLLWLSLLALAAQATGLVNGRGSRE